MTHYLKELTSMKKLFTAIIALTMTISTFTACGNVAESEPAAATTQSESASVTTTTAEPEVATTKPVTTPKATEVTTTSEAVISVDFTTPEVTAPPVITTTTTAVTTVTTTTAKQTTTTKKTTTTTKKKTTTTAKKTTTTAKKKTTTAAKKTTTTAKKTTTAPKKTTTTTTTTTTTARDWKFMREDEVEKLSEAEQNAYWDWYYERLENPDDEELINWHIQEAFRLTNEERARYGLEPYILDPIITKAAMIRAKELHVYASHTRPDGRSFATAIIDAGGTWELAGACGENICGSITPKQAIGAWIDSPGHHANLLGDYTRVGIGYYNEAWVMIFCTPDWEMQWE